MSRLKVIRAGAALAVLALSGCANVHNAVFKDPNSNQVAQCTSNAAGGFFPLVNAYTAQGEIDSCAAAYTRMGWIRQ